MPWLLWLVAILPKDHKFASYPKFPLVECETEAFITLLETSNHDANKALSAAGIKPNIRFSTKDDYAIIAMVEQGLGISIMPEQLLKEAWDWQYVVETKTVDTHIKRLRDKLSSVGLSPLEPPRHSFFPSAGCASTPSR